jgi:hypothetical protein
VAKTTPRHYSRPTTSKDRFEGEELEKQERVNPPCSVPGRFPNLLLLVRTPAVRGSGVGCHFGQWGAAVARLFSATLVGSLDSWVIRHAPVIQVTASRNGLSCSIRMEIARHTRQRKSRRDAPIRSIEGAGPSGTTGMGNKREQESNYNLLAAARREEPPAGPHS